MVLGISAAAGSFGQFAMLPLTQWLLSDLGWYGALLTLAAVGAADGAAGDGAGRRDALVRAHAFAQSAGQAMREALGHRGYLLLTLGFFVCGFQVVFIGVHLPAYLADKGMAPHVAVTALALVGLFNIVGTYTAGWLGGRMPKRYILSAIYFARAVVIALFVLLPLIAVQRVRVRDRAGPAVAVDGAADQRHRRAASSASATSAMLSGFTFFSHQIGSFLGAWLGGKPLRPDRQLRRRLVAGDRAGRRRRPHQPADRREGDPAPGAGVTGSVRVGVAPDARTGFPACNPQRGVPARAGPAIRAAAAPAAANRRPMRSTASVMMPSTPHAASSTTRAGSFGVQHSTR